MDPTTDTVSRVCGVLEDSHRRAVLYYLREHEQATLETLADCVTGWIQAGPGSDDATVEYDAVRTRLYHEHLPMMAEAGLLTFDPDALTVALEDIPPAVDEMLSTMLETETETESEPAAEVLGVAVADTDE